MKTMRTRAALCGLTLCALLGLPAVAGEKTVALNRANGYKANFSEGITNVQEGNTYVVSIGDVLAGVLKIKVTNKSTSFYPYVIITDKDKKQLLDKAAEAEGGNISDLQLRVGTGKQYYVTLKDYNGMIVTQPYTLDLQLVPIPNKYAPNNDFSGAKPIDLGQETLVTVFAPVDETSENYFSFALTKDTSLQVSIPAVKDMAPQIKIFNQHKEEVYSLYADANADLHGDANLPAGSYYIMVKDANELSSVIPFRLMLKAK